jgi:DNA-binding transcriptional LysR family regulator
MGYWRESSDDAWTLGARGQRRQVRVSGRYHANHPEVVADAALAGLGIAMLPGYLCAEALADGRLVRVLPAWTPITRFGDRILAVTTPERVRIARNKALIEFLRQQFGATV